MNPKLNTPAKKEKTPLHPAIVGLGSLFALLAVGLLTTLAVLTAPGQSVISAFKWLFAADSTQLWWYVTRSSAIIAYMLLWLSTAWGLAVPSKIVSPVLEAAYTFDFHEFISLLAIGFVLLHVSVLMLDRYMPYSLGQVLIPFLSTYRPLWVGIGVLSFYIMLLVTITFYLRNRIGSKTFRTIHVLSLLSYLGVTLHGLFAGTDGVLSATQILYSVTGLVVIFLTVYWLVQKIQMRRPAAAPQPSAKSAKTSKRIATR